MEIKVDMDIYIPSDDIVLRTYGMVFLSSLRYIEDDYINKLDRFFSGFLQFLEANK